ncbi:MAG: hypothetical protein WBN61_04865 [Woeseiaceae bacterium]
MRRFLTLAWALLLCAAVTALLASIFSSQFVIAGLQTINVDIPFSTRLSMTVADFGILTVLLPAVLACFLVAFLVAGLCAARLGGSRSGWFIAAGATSLVTELMIMQGVFGVMPVSGARSIAGLLAQGVAGAAGGYLFARITSQQTNTEKHIA